MGDLTLLESLAVVLGVAFGGSIIARMLRQPIILGYLVGGIVVGPHGLGLVSEIADVETLATVGVVLVMFTLGIEFSLKTLKRIGNVAIIGGVAQILITIGLVDTGRTAITWHPFGGITKLRVVLKGATNLSAQKSKPTYVSVPERPSFSRE